MKKAQTEISRTFEAICAEAAARRQATRQSSLPEIRIGLATCGIAAGALDTKQAFEQALAQRGL
jgi:NADH-quinone oxidoreductase subunit F